MNKNTLMIIDGNALVHRGYHALPDLKTPEGKLVNAVYGFFLVFLKAVKEIEPDYVCAAFDRPEPTFRHKKFKDYKAQRPKTPDELADQIPLIKKALEAMEIPVLEKPGFEADDIIATVAEKVAGEKTEVVIVSGDLDTLQLVDENVKVYGLKRGMKDTVLYSEEAVRKRYGFSPELLDDYRGLKGDPSDNIPGVKGVGDVTASKLLFKYGDLDAVYEALENAPQEFLKGYSRRKRVKKLLKEKKDEAYFSKELATARKDVPLDFKLDECSFQNHEKDKIEDLFRRWGFHSLIPRLPGNRRKQNNLFS